MNRAMQGTMRHQESLTRRHWSALREFGHGLDANQLLLGDALQIKQGIFTALFRERNSPNSDIWQINDTRQQKKKTP